MEANYTNFKILSLFIFFIFNKSILFSQDVYKTPHGDKYHTEDCKMVENTSLRLTIIEARDLGLEPCKICKPEDHGGATKRQKKSQGESEIKHQCIGKTKAGYICKHFTKIANSYCYQHTPKE